MHDMMIISLAIFAITYFFIATEKVDKAIAALLGAAAAIAFKTAPYEELLHKIDMNVIFLLIGMMLIVTIMSNTGIFEYLAILIARKAKGNGLLIVGAMLLLTAILSALLDNVTTVILIAPITILIAQILEIPAMPILALEAVFSNIGGTSTLVGDPPNIIIGSKAGLSFNAFVINLGPPVLVLLVLMLIMTTFIMRKKFIASESTIARIMKAKPELAIVEPAMLKRSLIIFCLVIIGFIVSHSVNIEPGVIALAGGFTMALVCKVDIHKTIEKVEWTTILFFIGLFMLIGALEHNHVFEKLGEHILHWTSGNLLLTALIILWAGAFMSAIVDNIPLVIAMIPLIKSISPVFAVKMGLTGAAAAAQIDQPLFWALALGACLGGNGTLIGASANVVIAQIARRNNYALSFVEFLKYGFPAMILSLIVSSFYIYFAYFY